MTDVKTFSLNTYAKPAVHPIPTWTSINPKIALGTYVTLKKLPEKK